MGYCMNQEDSDFFIPKKHKAAALKAVKALASKKTVNQDTWDHFSWVGADFASKKTLEEISQEWRWVMETNDQGDIVGISFSGEKRGDDEVFLRAIAPFLKEHSHITMRGEDGFVWKWTFDGAELDTLDGHVTFAPEIPPEGVEVLKTVLKEEATAGTLGLLLRGVLNRRDLDRAKEFVEAWGNGQERFRSLL